jgi:hypothetical protein
VTGATLLKIACHQPCYLPWPGFFYKVLRTDVIVLLDSVQLPRGTSWVTRNRIKTPGGQVWLTVPVKRKGRSLQKIMDTEIFNERDWRRTHLESLIHAYKRAPFSADHFPFFKKLYAKDWHKLVELNLSLVRHLMAAIGANTDIVLSSELALDTKGTPLIVEICKKMEADVYSTITTSRKHLDEERFAEAGIRLDYYTFKCPAYPQLWGEFIPNLSIVDMLLSCGPKTRSIIEKGGH